MEVEASEKPLEKECGQIYRHVAAIHITLLKLYLATVAHNFKCVKIIRINLRKTFANLKLKQSFYSR